MTQKTGLANILRSMDWKPARYKFISEWLEDINWHSENTLLMDRLDNPNRLLLDELQEFDYCIRAGNYSASFIRDHRHELTKYDTAVSEFQNNNSNSGIIIGLHLYTRHQIYDFQRFNMYSAMSYI